MSQPTDRIVAGATPKVGGLAETVRQGAAMAGPSAPSGDADELRRLTAENGRYALAATLGTGATSEVHRAHDRIFQREVAIKILNTGDQGTTERFIHAARLTARLEHPSIIPVYDLDWPIGGGARLVMRRVVGISLGVAIRQAEAGQAPGQISDVNRILTVILKVCDAVALAHSREVIHRDLKPDNILLGEWGEVMVVDWGEASELHEPGSGSHHVVGTPTYMSPEQSGGTHHADARSDVYCLGATLFHALYLRPPLGHGTDLARFWQRKHAGEIDPLTPIEERRVPRRLSAIVRRALAGDPAERYQTISAFADDLHRFQAGQAVRAYHESAFETAARWLYQHARMLAVGTLVLASLGGALALVWGERLKEIASWGEAVLSDDFTDDSWRDRWATHLGDFARRDGRLVTTDKTASVLMCRQRFSGATAIEFTGEVLPGSPLCDLSVWWCRDIDFSADGSRAPNLKELYKLQVGAYDNSYTAIILPNERQVASNPFRLAHGTKYRVRAEIVDNRLRLLVDGRLLCEYIDPFPFSSGYVGIYGYYPGKAFAQVRIHALGVPEKLSATAIGDAFAGQQLYAQAGDQYARVVATHPGTSLGQEALYKEGLCWLRNGDPDRAEATWVPLALTPFAEDIALHRIDRSFAAGDHDAVFAAIGTLAKTARAEIRDRLAQQWATYAYEVLRLAENAGKNSLLTDYLRVHDQTLSDLDVAARAAAECLIRLGRIDELLIRYPTQRHCCAKGLSFQGRMIELVHGYPDQFSVWYQACVTTGHFAELIAQSEEPDWIAYGKTMSGRGAEALTDRRLSPRSMGDALISLGRYDEVLAMPGVASEHVALALIALGRAAEIGDETQQGLALMAQNQPQALLDRLPATSVEDRQWPRCLLGLEAHIAGGDVGDQASARAWFALPTDMKPLANGNLAFAYAVIEPILREEAGDTGALAKRCAEISTNERYTGAQVPWHAAQFLSGELSAEEFLAQPNRLSARAWLLACSGIVAERRGDTAQAQTAYRDYLALPPQRHGLSIDPLMDRFVAWRAERLAAGKGWSGSTTP